VDFPLFRAAELFVAFRSLVVLTAPILSSVIGAAMAMVVIIIVSIMPFFVIAFIPPMMLFFPTFMFARIAVAVREGGKRGQE
jgi:hypothetical protein